MENKNTNIGYLTTFSKFIDNYKIEIPRIQRDYTYGSKTEKTEKVLTKLLKDIHDSLQNNDELILDFVYGCDNDSFNPLDGQQRLTTLYLLYYFAACKAGVSVSKSFKYATRDDSTIFCEELKKLKYDVKEGSLVKQIIDSPFYRPSFNDDPSIRSMLAVLERIETKFLDMVQEDNPSLLWDAINNKDCPVKFYCLDFGKFTLSDDLYIKMNSRGKQLTEYEIFKSQFEKYIEVTLNNKELMYNTAKSFDNEYTDLVWDSQGKDKSKIDHAFINLFKNIFALLYYKFKGDKVPFDWGKPIYENMLLLNINEDDVNFIRKFMGNFIYIQQERPNFLKDNFYFDDSLVLDDGRQSGKIRFFKSKVDVFADACNSVMKNPQLVSLYAVYKAIEKEKAGVAWQLNFRHIRNLIEFSDDELSHEERLPSMLSEIDKIIDGKLNSIIESKFNAIQFEEEIDKERNQTEWSKLFVYENHDILRGSLSQFAYPEQFNLADRQLLSSLCERLRKFTFIFDNDARENDCKIRAFLLSIGDIGQQHKQDVFNRMVGCQYGSWRLMFTKSAYYKTIRVMEILDKVNLNNKIEINQVAKDDWRYYVSAEKYYDYTYVSYRAPKYGYYYTEDPNKPLEMWLLQSTSCNKDNVMWKMLNCLLYSCLPEGLSVAQGNYQNDHEVKLNGNISIDALQEGWLVKDLTEDGHIMKWLQSNTDINKDCVIPHAPNTDCVEEIIKIIEKLIAEKILKITTDTIIENV